MHEGEESLHQTVHHIRARLGDEMSDVGNGVVFEYMETPVELLTTPPVGTAYVQTLFSAPCGSDHVYYGNGRFRADLDNVAKLESNLAIMGQRGVIASSETKADLIATVNHEGWGIVKRVTPNANDIPREISAFVPVLSEDGRKIIGVRHVIRQFDAQDIHVEDWAITDAALRCDFHWQINPATGFPDACNRSTENGHNSKQVPGHMETEGDSFNAEYGLPFPNQMLTKVPSDLRSFALVDPERRLKILTTMEPLSCCFEAFAPVLMAMQYKGEPAPKNIAILGDGQNAALLAFTATMAFPEAQIYVTGKTDEKLDAIAAINPQRIHTINTRKIHGHREIGDRMWTEFEESEDAEWIQRKKFDIIVPTFPVQNLNNYATLVDKDRTRIIVWASSQVGDNTPFEGLVRADLIHHSYGGFNKAEWSACNLADHAARLYPERLDALANYPVHVMGLREAADAMTKWLANGKHAVTVNGLYTSGKVIIDNRRGIVFAQEAQPIHTSASI